MALRYVIEGMSLMLFSCISKYNSQTNNECWSYHRYVSSINGDVVKGIAFSYSWIQESEGRGGEEEGVKWLRLKNMLKMVSHRYSCWFVTCMMISLVLAQSTVYCQQSPECFFFSWRNAFGSIKKKKNNLWNENEIDSFAGKFWNTTTRLTSRDREGESGL